MRYSRPDMPRRVLIAPVMAGMSCSKCMLSLAGKGEVLNLGVAPPLLPSASAFGREGPLMGNPQAAIIIRVPLCTMVWLWPLFIGPYFYDIFE